MKFILFWNDNLRVSDGLSLHHQEFETVHTATAICQTDTAVCLQAPACNTDTTPTQPHRNSNTHRTKNNTTNVVIQQSSRKLLMMDILISETC